MNGRKRIALGKRPGNERRPGLTKQDQVSFCLPSAEGAGLQSRIDHHTSKQDDVGKEPSFQQIAVDNNPEDRPDLGSAGSSLAMTRQETEVFELLRGLSTKEQQFHEWYRGAILIINSQSPDRIAQAAHSIREICDRLPKCIGNIPGFKNPISAVKQFGSQFLKVKEQSYGKGWKGNTINQPLDEVLCRFETLFSEPPRARRFGRALVAADPQGDALPKDWRKERDKAFEALVVFFQNVAHHNHSAPETEFRERLELFEALLLNYLTPCTAAQQKELLTLVAAPVNADTFARISELISHKAANFTFFLDKLDNPNWLPLLDESGYFRNLPEPEPTEDGRILYRYHLPFMVLTRLAGSAPRAVTDILKTLRLPENPFVGDQVLQCMARIRDPACIKQLGPLISQLSENSARASWLWIEELLKSWLELNVFQEVFAVTQGCLNRAVDLSLNQFSNDSNVWLVKQVDEKFLGQLSVQHPFEVATVLFRVLCRWADQERRKYKESELSDDAPFAYWQEDFKTPPPAHRRVEATLAVRLFSAAEQIYRKGDLPTIDELENLLRSHAWQLFRRLRWQLYADFPALSLDRARVEVLARMPFLNEIDYSRGSHDYEFAQLLTSHVKQHGSAFLSPEEVAEFATTVLKGPIGRDGKLVEQYRDVFCRKQLWPIAPLLQGEQFVAYRAIVEDTNGIDVHSYKPYHSGGVLGGEVVGVLPSEADKLGAMETKDLWNFLNTWQPTINYAQPGRWVAEDIFALGTRFAELVEQRPDQFSPETKWWENITRPEILNRALERAAGRVAKRQNDGHTLTAAPSEDDWANWLGMTKWVMGQPWPRDAVARFLGKLLESDSAIPDSYFSEFPELLQSLIEQEDLRLQGGKNSFRDWLTTAINSIRGDAIEALLSLALRQKNAGREVEPWILEIVRSRLELAEESPAIFALLGAKLRLLIHLFGNRLKELQDLLFPPARPEHRSAALVAHFKYDHPWSAIIAIFPGFINTALDTLEAIRANVKDNDEREDFREFGYRLGTHIACYYWCGSFADDTEGEAALDRFFAIASSTTRAVVINEIGTIWEKPSDGPPDEKAVARVIRIWERRYAQIVKKLENHAGSASDYDGELAQSIDWLDCECFPLGWRLAHAKSALQRLQKAPQAYRLLKTISAFGVVPNRLEGSLQLLRTLLSKPGDEVRWSISTQDLGPVLSSGFASGNPEIRRLAKECQDMLLKRGFSDFLSLGE